MVSKVKTNIPGFDTLLGGGFPKNSSILITGTPGTAKTIFSMQYSYAGAKDFGERVLYVSFEQTKDSIFSQCKQFGWNLKELEKKGLFHLLTIPVSEIHHETVQSIFEYVKTHKIQRLVIDSLSTLSINAPMYAAINDLFLRDLITRDSIVTQTLSPDYILKRFIYWLVGELQKLSVTALLISEIGQDSAYLSSDSVSEFLCDGVVQFMFESMGGEYSRSLLVRKMRQVKHNEDIHPVEITKKGIVVHNLS